MRFFLWTCVFFALGVIFYSVFLWPQNTSAKVVEVPDVLTVVEEKHQLGLYKTMSLYKVYDNNNGAVCYLLYEINNNDSIGISCLK